METNKQIKELKQRFSEASLDDEFNWMREDSDNSLFHCVICNQDFPFDSMSSLTEHEQSQLHTINIKKNKFVCDGTFSAGLSHIKRHANSKAHSDNLEYSDYIQTSEKESDEDMQIDDESFVPFEVQRRTAETRFAALIADKDIELETAKEILNFFQDVVSKDPRVLQQMELITNTNSNEPQ